MFSAVLLGVPPPSEVLAAFLGPLAWPQTSYHPPRLWEPRIGGRANRTELSQAVHVCTCPGHLQSAGLHTRLCHQGHPAGSQLRPPTFPFLELSLKWATLGPHLFSYTSQRPPAALPGYTLPLLAQSGHYSSIEGFSAPKRKPLLHNPPPIQTPSSTYNAGSPVTRP